MGKYSEENYANRYKRRKYGILMHHDSVAQWIGSVCLSKRSGLEPGSPRVQKTGDCLYVIARHWQE